MAVIFAGSYGFSVFILNVVLADIIIYVQRYV